MKPHPGIRKTIKWGGLALSVVLVGVWIASGWCWMGWTRASGYGACVVHGRMFVGPYWTPSLKHDDEWLCMPMPTFDLVWGPWTASRSGEQDIPLWLPVGAVLGGTVVAWRLDTLAARRVGRDLCAACRYDRTGLASKDARCPECGSDPA